LIDHTNDTLIDFKNSASLSSEFFKLLEKSFDQDSQMEFNSSRFFTAISIDIFNFNNLWNVLNNFNKSINLVNLNDVN
jgi:hypothetical protein